MSDDIIRESHDPIILDQVRRHWNQIYQDLMTLRHDGLIKDSMNLLEILTVLREGPKIPARDPD